MKYELTFKFNSRLALTKNLIGVASFEIPDGYYEQALIYHTKVNETPLLLDGTALFPFKDLEQALIPAWADFSQFLARHPLLNPRFLFRYNPVDFANRLWDKLTDGNPLPNLYNYFTLPLPDEYEPEQIVALLDEIERFLPHKALKPDFFLLEYAYLKTDPEPLATLGMAVRNGGNQRYFNDLRLQPIPAEGQGDGVTLTIIEADSWYLNHEQFKSSVSSSVLLPPAPVLMFPAPLRLLQNNPGSAPRFSLLDPDGVDEIAEHGTKILGVLKARPDVTNAQPTNTDLCRGIVPRARIHLASCLVELTLQGTVKKARIRNEPDALLASLVGSQPGDVVLIEVGAGDTGFPLEIQPAIFELLRVAHRRRVTVVEAAGNGRAYIGKFPVSESMNVERLNLRKAVAKQLTGTVSDEGNRTYWQSYQAVKDRTAHLLDGAALADFTSAEDFANHYMESDSGALLVGAIASSNPISRLYSSSRGERVRVYAQGENILTTTYSKDSLHSQFDITQETSGAAAIMAGVVVSLQSVAKANPAPGRTFVDPDKIEELLTAPGSTPAGSHRPVADSQGGVMPNYQRALADLRTYLSRRP